MPAKLTEIEQRILDLLPLQGDKPDIDGTGSPDIAQVVLQTRDAADVAALQPFFKKRSSEEGWREIARTLASALVTIDKEHRQIIKTIRSA